MKKILIFFFFIVVCKTTFAQAFVTTWTLNNNAVNYVYFDASGTNYNISWEEVGNPSHNGNMIATNGALINFGKKSGTYKVNISGGSPKFNSIQAGVGSPNATLISVDQWGDIKWSTMKNAFADCHSLMSVPDSSPDLSLVNDMSGMFRGCYSLVQGCNNWDVSNVKNMSNMFSGCTSFNQPLYNWNTSNVTNMSSIFLGATSFNQPLDNYWNTSNVTNMSRMFYQASSFNENLNTWNTQKVKDMSEMFFEALSFNQPIDNWNVDSVLNFSYMFYKAQSFNQPLNSWNTISATNMIGMFSGALSFNQPLNSWNVNKVTNFNYMFGGAAMFNQPLNNWNTVSVTNFANMFKGAVMFNQSINNWNANKVTDLSNMFEDASSFNQPLNNWNTSKVVGMDRMFHRAVSFNQPLNNWNTSKVVSMISMFEGAYTFNQPLNNWNTAAVYQMNSIFDYAASFNQNIGNWNMNQVSTIGLDYSGIQYNNYDSIIISWATKKVGSLWINATALHYCNSLIQRNNAITSKYWKFVGDTQSCTLPIQLISFTATPQQNKVLLQWHTATETNNNYFTVQLSSNKDNWQDIATIKGAGNSSVAKKYTAIDNNPLQGISYYRIQQTDFNGSVSYSEVRRVELGIRNLGISIYPNPAKDVVKINSNENALLNVYNTLGKLVLSQNISKGNNTILLSSLSNGLYVFNIIGGKSQYYKVVKD